MPNLAPATRTAPPEPPGSADRRWRVATCATLAAAAAVRLVNLGGPGLWADEAASLKVALHPIPEILLRSNDLTPPLYYALLNAWVGLFGMSAAAMRSLSASLGVAAVALAGWGVRRLIGPQGAILAMALLAVSPLAVLYAQTARSYSLFLVLSIASFGFLHRWEARGRRGDAVLWLGTTAAMAYTHNYWVFNFVAQQAYVLAGVVRRRVRFGPWLAMTAAFALVFAPWVPRLLRRTARYSSSSSDAAPPDLGELFHAVQRWVVWQDLAPGSRADVAGLLSLPFLALALFGLVRLIDGRLPFAALPAILDSRPALLLGLWAAVPVLLPWGWSQFGARIFEPPYLIGALPAYCALVAHGLLKVPWRTVRACLLVFMACVGVADMARMATRTAKQDWPGVAALLAAEAGPDDVVVVSSRYHEIVLAYYRNGPAAVAGRVGSVPGWQLADRLAAGVDRARGLRARLWVVAMLPDDHSLASRLVDDRASCARLALSRGFTGFTLVAFDFSGCREWSHP